MSEQLKLITDVQLLKGTQYFEFLPGEYTKVCWNKQSAYLAEEDFNVIEGLVVSVVKDFDHFAFGTWDSNLIRQLSNELRATATDVAEVTSASDLATILLTNNATLDTNPDELYQHRDAICEMMQALSDWLENACQTHDKVSILGM